jgi:hypothetical protein
MSEAEADARAILEDWWRVAILDLAYLEARKAGGRPEQKEENLEWNIFLAKTQLENIPSVLDAAARGHAWRAAFLALYIGMRAGQGLAESNTYHARRKIRLDITERAWKASRAPRPKIRARRAEALRIFSEDHERLRKTGFPEICRRVARKTGYSAKQIERIADKNGLRF